MGILVNIDHYKVFYYAAKYQNITRAARELYLTQPAATRTLHNLEAQIGCQLFVRNARGVSLTTEGELLYRELIPAFQSLENAQNVIEQAKNLESGMIRIGVNDMSAEYMLATKLYHFKKQYPGIVDIRSRMEPLQLFDAVSEGWIDFALYSKAVCPNETSPESICGEWKGGNLQQREVGVFTDSFLVGPKYAYLAKRKIDLDELALLPLIAPIKQTAYKMYYVNMIRHSGKLMERDYSVNGAENRITLVKQNHGFTFYPREFVPQALHLGTIYPIQMDQPMCTHHIYVLTCNKRHQSIAVQKLIDHILYSSISDFDWSL